MLKHAMSFARRGLAVLPLAGKVPITPNGLKDATADLDIVAQMWTRWPSANVGIATGTEGGIIVLDVDGEVGKKTIAELEAVHGELKTVQVVTGNGGFHYWFRSKPGISNRAKFIPGCDFRGAGGFVVSPWSTHPNGRLYIWGPNCAASIADIPAWLEDLVRRPTPACKTAFDGGSIPEGSRNDTIARLAGKLLRQWALEPDFILDLVMAFNEARCVPPLPADEVRRTVESIARKEMARRESLKGPLQTPASPSP